MNLEQAKQRVYQAYDNMFKNGVIILDKLYNYLDIVSYYADSDSWTFFNCLLLLDQAPEYRNLFPEEWFLERRAVVDKGQTPVSLIGINTDTNKYQVIELFDQTQTSAADTAEYLIPVSDSKTTLTALIASLKSINWDIAHYEARNVPWKDWARVSNEGPKADVGTIIFRNPTPHEEQTMGWDRAYACMCRDIWKSFALFYLFYDDDSRSPDGFPMKYLPQSELYADLMCTRYKLFDSHEFVHIPNVLQGQKYPIKDFRETFEPVLELMNDTCELMDHWMNHYINPKDPIDIKLNEEGSDAD